MIDIQYELTASGLAWIEHVVDNVRAPRVVKRVEYVFSGEGE